MPTLQNGQTHSNNLSVIFRRIVWVYLTTWVCLGLALKELKWFKDNQTLADPGKFQFLVLSKTAINHSIEILNKKIGLFKPVKLLGWTADNKLNFDIHISNLCKVGSAKPKRFKED